MNIYSTNDADDPPDFSLPHQGNGHIFSNHIRPNGYYPHLRIRNMNNIPVRLYTLSTCVHCNAIKRMLLRHDIQFEWTDIDRLPKEEQEQFFAETAPHNPKKSFPIVIIGNKAIVGDQRELIMKELGIADGS